MLRPVVRLASVGASGYVASAANDAAVAALVAQGFSEEQAKAIVANAKKSPEQVAKEAAESAKGYVESEANRLAVDKLKAAGFTEDEAKKIVASGRNVDALLDNLKAISVKRIEKAAVDLIAEKFPDMPLAEVQAFAATGGDPKKLLSLLSNEEQRNKLLKAIDSRLKQAGIDLQSRVAQKLGLTAEDQANFNQAVQAAQGAYDLFMGVESMVENYSSSHYFAARWSEANMSDESLANLARTLQTLADQTDAERARRERVMIEGARAVAGGVSTIASAFGPIGMAVGAAVQIAERLGEVLGAFEPEKNDNDSSFLGASKNAINTLWTEWFLKPPTFNADYYTIFSYGETIRQQIEWLEQSNTELAWKAEFKSVLRGALFGSVVGGVATPVVDLATIGWLPLSFQDWAAGANYPSGNRFHPADAVDVYPLLSFPFGGLPEELTVGNEGLYIGDIFTLENDTAPGSPYTRTLVFNNKAATYEARNQSTPSVENGWRDEIIDPLGAPQFPAGYLLARNKWTQKLICDRMAASLATMVAVVHGVAAEPIVEATVKASRDMIATYGWQPYNAARRLRDTFRTAMLAAKASTPLVGAPKYAPSAVRAGSEVVRPIDVRTF